MLHRGPTLPNKSPLDLWFSPSITVSDSPVISPSKKKRNLFGTIYHWNRFRFVFFVALSESYPGGKSHSKSNDLVSRTLQAATEQRKLLYNLLHTTFVGLLPEKKEKDEFCQKVVNFNVFLCHFGTNMSSMCIRLGYSLFPNDCKNSNMRNNFWLLWYCKPKCLKCCSFPVITTNYCILYMLFI